MHQSELSICAGLEQLAKKKREEQATEPPGVCSFSVALHRC